jgi:Domain of unknown function (DUF4153)
MAIRFPSFRYLASQAKRSAARFYLPLAIALLGTYMGLLLVDTKTAEPLFRVLLTCLLGLPLSVGCVLFAERSDRPIAKWLMPAIPIVFMFLYWMWLAPSSFEHNLQKVITFFVLAVVMHLWVAIAPYITHNERIGFWQYNESLFTRMLLSLVFSATMYAGLAVALSACRILFKIDIKGETFGRLFIVVIGMFNTWFFLAGMPDDFRETNNATPFPGALKIFTQYILIPIVSLYMIILYAYGIQIISMWSLPKGWVSTLIFCYSVVGILAILLVYPLRDEEENAWVRLFSRLFFRASLPLLVLLYTAIWTRVRHYGITESRYYLVLLGLWLGFISLYFIISRQKNIRTIPVSLAVIGILSLAGPWNAFSFSASSQYQRLERLLAKYDIHPNTGKQHPTKVGYTDAQEIRSIISFFVERDNITRIQPFYAGNLHQLQRDIIKKYPDQRTRSWETDNDLKDSLFSTLCSNSPEETGIPLPNQLYFTLGIAEGYDISGYRRVYDMSLSSYQNEQWIQDGADSLLFRLQQDRTTAFIIISGHGKTIDSLPMAALLKGLSAKGSHAQLSEQDMTLTGPAPRYTRFVFNTIYMRSPFDSSSNSLVNETRAYVLLK